MKVSLLNDVHLIEWIICALKGPVCSFVEAVLIEMQDNVHIIHKNEVRDV